MQETLSANEMGLLNIQKKAVPFYKVLVTKFNPCMKGLRKRLMNYWHNIQHDEVCKKIFTTPHLVAYSKHKKNIGNLIIRSKFKPNGV